MNYNRIYDSIVEYRRSNKPTGYVERHHIIPRSLGGSDELSNLVYLTAREHYICHLLLVKIHKNNKTSYRKMLNAFMYMSTSNNKHQERTYKVNSKIYEQLRIELSKVMSNLQKGDQNTQYGTYWVYNPTLKESKRISDESDLEEGWIKGRVTNWDTHFSQKKCPICGNIGLPSFKSKFCSIECSAEHKAQNSFVNANKDAFRTYYIQTESIHKSLMMLGKHGFGNYSIQAVKLIKNDPVMLEIYNRTKK